MNQRKIIQTEDGSHSIFVPELKEHYHSTFGALTESQHIFINAGFKLIASNKKKINILEIGFGTGLNAILTFIEAKETNTKINYTALEYYPLPLDFIKQLNYVSLINKENTEDIFQKMHTCEWNKNISLSDFFTLHKINNNLLDFVPDKNTFDLVYFDAFGPDVQPELWTNEVFQKIASSMIQGGIFVTYSTKGDVKRALKNTGFTIEKLPGPPGKREILRAKLV